MENELDRKVAKMWKDILGICEAAYIEGRQHQFDDDFPDVGMHFKQKFSDTIPYNTIMKQLKEKL